MRKVGILSDTEQTRNRDFKKTQLASREHIASRLAKAKSIEKELKYADRVPARVPGGLVRVNLRETMTGVDRRVYVDKPVAQSNAESNVAQQGGDTATVSGRLMGWATGVIQGTQGAAQGAASALNNLGVSTYPFRGEGGEATSQPSTQTAQKPRRSGRSNKGKAPTRLITTKD